MAPAVYRGEEQDRSALPVDLERCRSALAVFSVAFLAFLPSLWNGFTFDDYVNVVDNPLIRTFDGALQAFAQPFFPGNLYRPLTNLTHYLVYQSFGLWPAPHHVLNIGIHVTASLLLLAVMRQLCSERCAICTALLWATMPIHSEAVAGVTGRSELLGAMLGLSATWAALSIRSICWRGVAVFVLLLLAMLSKESGLIWAIAPVIAAQKKGLRVVTLAIPAAAAVGAYMTARSFALGGAVPSMSMVSELDNPLVSFAPVTRIAYALALLGRYIAVSLVPYSLGADYSYGYLYTGRLEAWWAVTGIITILAIFLLTTRVGGWQGLAWFFYAFALTANIVMPIGTIFAERLAYTPSMGLAAFVGAQVRTRAESVLALFLVAGSMVCAALSAPFWQSNDALFTRQIEVSPQSVKTRLNYAVVLRNHNELALAEDYTRSVMSDYPKSAEAAYVLATIYVSKHINSGAVHWLHRALELNPDHIPSLQTLGRIYAQQGKVENALSSFQRAISVDPHDTRSWVGLYAIAITQQNLALMREAELRLASLAPDDREFHEWKTRAAGIEKR